MRNKFLVLIAFIGLFGCNLSTGPSDIKVQDKAPNVVILIADDLGYGDIGAYGSEISTPNIDRLAGEGISFINFHVGATCSPTRSMLISGADNHRAGLGNMYEIMADNQFGKPGHEGYLNDHVVSLATVMRDAGYHTYMAGKWHLGGDSASIPYAKGFERSFALVESGADNWVDMPYSPMYEKVHYFEDDRAVSLPTDNYFSTDFYTKKIIDYIESGRDDGKPFLVWLGYQAVHYPHQAPKEFIDKYKGFYDNGWEELRRVRFEKQKELGIVPYAAAYDENFGKTTIPDWMLPDWDALSAEEKRFNARRMETYAGMLDNMDYNIGLLMNYLEQIGEAENTLVIFMSDNGTDPNLLPMNPAYQPWYKENYPYTYMEDYSDDYSMMGQKGSYSNYGAGWASASNTPHSYFKGFSTEGGLRVPFIAWFPKQIPGGRMSEAFAFVKDVYPTVLEMAGIDKPGDTYKGKKVHPPSGASAWGLLTGESTYVHEKGKAIGYELAGSSAIFRDNFKLSRNPPPYGTGEWELYDIIADPAEVHNLADENPDLVAELKAAYDLYVEENGVVPVPEGYNPLEQMVKNSQKKHGH